MEVKRNQFFCGGLASAECDVLVLEGRRGQGQGVFSVSMDNSYVRVARGHDKERDEQFVGEGGVFETLYVVVVSGYVALPLEDVVHAGSVCAVVFDVFGKGIVFSSREVGRGSRCDACVVARLKIYVVRDCITRSVGPGRGL